ncbi:hypoxanthine phosphoribosyltransferase [Clostridium acidisoli DSM 12555]|jgi:hypoxanthine phosphoribosyltransferase|uniref:Hypoxanthine phosphoribosyltransferase n=1 Tax=Clostridium acidisoli DSM 12555 TaxID=1121291 RepID=A0A1W1XYE1_9CLOT|nr:hypoxanthine phosphoribosyltransferase [Clostridium acidisoli]SMC28979.1 hypoxanthine phosphoribosyltransferase [Clostridium acidisoli DSM 12555]
MKKDIKEVVLTELEIKNKVKEIGRQISIEYKDKNPILVGILKGSVIFLSDLMKEIDIPCTMDFMAVSSYGNSTESTGIVKIIKDLDSSIEGENVIIVEDIIDTGVTLSYLNNYLKARKPKSIEIVTLLNKPSRRKVEIVPKYYGFSVPDYFLVGYGLDFAEKYRNLPFIGSLKEEIYK